MSASWFLVSTYLIWILESKLILSNNQSNATQCFLDTRFLEKNVRFVGRYPLLFI